MKKTITILLIMLSMSVLAQSEVHDRGFSYFVGGGIDTRMAWEGPYAGQPNDIGSTFNTEIKIGIDWEHNRLSLGMENHHEINYYKFFADFGWKINDFYIPFTDAQMKNFTILYAFEGSVIKRGHPDNHYTNPKNYRRSTHTFSIGVNFELLYTFVNTPLSAGVNYNLFTAEDQDSFGNDMKAIRTDVMFNLYYRF